jgi:hypothetical protein
MTVRDVRNSELMKSSKISLLIFWLNLVDSVQYMLEEIENEAGVHSSGSGFTAAGQLTVE